MRHGITASAAEVRAKTTEKLSHGTPERPPEKSCEDFLQENPNRYAHVSRW